MASDNRLVIDVVLDPKADRSSFKQVESKSKEAGSDSAKQFSRGFKAKLSTSLTGIRSTLTGVIAGAFAVKKGIDIFGNAIRGAADFEQAITEVNTILPKTEKIARSTVAQLREFGRQYGTGATAQVKSFYQIVSAGILDAEKGLQTLSAANKLAIGGLADVGSSINILTDINNVFGGSMDDAANSLFKTVQLGKTTIPELASALGMALAPAKNLGLELDDVNATLATLTTRGNTTSENVTQLTSLLSALAKNSEKLGKGFTEAEVKNRDFAETLELLQKRTNGSSTALFKLLGRKEAVTAFLKLSGDGFQKLGQNIEQFNDKGSAASDAFKLMERSSAFQFKVFDANIASLQNSLGQLLLPLLNKVVGGFNAVSEAVNRAFLKPEDKTRLENITNEMGRLQGKIKAVQNTVKDKDSLTSKIFGLDDFVNSGKAATRIDELKAKLKALEAERDSIFKNQTERDRALRKAALDAQMAESEKEAALIKAKSLGFTKLETLERNYQSNLKALQIAFQEGQIESEGEFLARRAVLEGQFQEARRRQEEKTFMARASFSELLKKQLKVDSKSMQKDLQNLAQTSKQALIGGVGNAFKAMGAAMRNGENEWQAFKDALQSVVGDIAGMVGDMFIKWGIGNLASGNIGMGSAQIAAGGALKILGGMLGADVQSRSGGAASRSDRTDDRLSDTNPQIIQDQNVERETQQAVNITIEGSLVQQEELGKFISDVISESNEKNGNVIINPRFA